MTATDIRPDSQPCQLPLEDSPLRLDQHGPIFIVGCPRSGTTFLSSCVGSIDQIEQFVGVLAPPRMMHMIGRLSHLGDPSCEDLLWVVRDIFWQAFWRRIMFRAERVVQVLYRRKPLRWALTRPSLDGRYFCYKEPFLAFAVNEICAHFPAAKILHIIRDGRDNADSLTHSYPHALSDQVLSNRSSAMSKVSEIGFPIQHGDSYVPWWVERGQEDAFLNCSQYGRYVWMWREMVSRVRTCGASIGDARYLELRYESVVAEPQKNAEQIVDFLGFDTSRSLLARLGRGHSASVGISRRNQSSTVLNEAAEIAGPLLKSLEYV